MSKYYREEDLEKALIGFIRETGIDEKPYDYAVNVLDTIPTINIVLCKDCKCFLNPDCHPFEFCMDYTNVNCYCSYGERKDNE